ncbi:Hint domain-containing protein [Novacetimonas hansenii]|nr:Hint domain-containing protein [Novacetimonas hansenii]GBQ52581.1 hypothetical protein AA0243_0069 [Novacetimonas hansenii NRIC 0243]
MTQLFGTGNSVTSSGTYDLMPIAVLGILGSADATVSSSTGAEVDATINITGLLDLPVTALSTYTITAEKNTSVTVSAGSVAIGTETILNADGGTISLGGGLLNAATGVTINLSNGGTFNGSAVISALSGATSNFESGGGVLNLAGSSTGLALLSGASIKNFGTGDSIIIESNGSPATISSVSYNSLLGTTDITFSNNDSVTLTGEYQNTDPTASNYVNAVAESGDTGTVIVCFLSGTMIQTPTGDIAVEALQVGDAINIFDCSVPAGTTRNIVWAGHHKAVVRPHLPDDEAGYPVRIVKDAITDGVPYKDMLITAEHCLFFDGKFVPVRMLVNGRSIFYDKSITSYDYYHIETAQHSVIMADGMLSESYLDTGNRRNFHQAGNVVRIGSSPRNWADDAAAPLAVNRDFVEPLFHRIGERAIASGHAPRSEPPIVETNADLHLVTKTGAVLRTMREANGHAFFMIPPGIEEVRIMSRTGRPSDMVGPYVDDRRHLGVLVRSIKLFEGNIARPVTSHLAPDAPAGWHDGGYMPCKEPCRWTDGQATLPLGHRHPTLMGLLCLEIIAGGPYNVEKDNIPQNDTRLTA